MAIEGIKKILTKFKILAKVTTGHLMTCFSVNESVLLSGEIILKMGGPNLCYCLWP